MKHHPLTFLITLVLLFATACGQGPKNQEPLEVSPAIPISTLEPSSDLPEEVESPPQLPSPTLAPAEPTSTPTQEPEPVQPPATGRVNVNGLNLRIGPGLDHLVVRLLPEGQELEIQGRNEKMDWLLVTLPSGTQGWVYAEYVDTDAVLAELPLREAYGGPIIVEQPVADQDERKPLNIQAIIENDITTVTVSGFPGESSIYAGLGLPGVGIDLIVANGSTSANGNAVLIFTIPETWSNGEPITSGEMILMVGTTDGGFGLEVSIQYDYEGV